MSRPSPRINGLVRNEAFLVTGRPPLAAVETRGGDRDAAGLCLTGRPGARRSLVVTAIPIPAACGVLEEGDWTDSWIGFGEGSAKAGEEGLLGDEQS